METEEVRMNSVINRKELDVKQQANASEVNQKTALRLQEEMSELTLKNKGLLM